MTKRKGRVGSSFDDFLEEEGLLEEVTAGAVKKVLALQLRQAMKQQRITKVAMARRMRTSRSQLDRLLDPANSRVQLDTLYKAASAVGHMVRLELADGPARRAAR